MLSLPVLLVTAIMAVQGNTECEWGKYGEHCNLTCPQNCGLVPPHYLQFCNRDTGKCSEGCRHGWHGDLCETGCNINCPEKTCNQQTGHCTLDCNGTNVGVFCNITRDCGRGLYGDRCQHPCSINCVEERCNHTTGVCILGCSGTYTGEFCNTTKVVNNKEDSNSLVRVSLSVAVLVTVATTVIFTLTVTLTVILFLRKRRQTNSSRSPGCNCLHCCRQIYMIRGGLRSKNQRQAEPSEVASCMVTDGDLHNEELSLHSGDFIKGSNTKRKRKCDGCGGSVEEDKEQLRDCEETYGRVTMSGAPEEGKTTISVTLETEYLDEGYEVVSVNDILKFNLQHYVNQGKDMCFIFHDVFKTVELPKDTTLLQRLLYELKSYLKKRHSENGQKLYAIFTMNSYSDTGQIPQLGEVGDYFFSGPPFINFNVGYRLKI